MFSSLNELKFLKIGEEKNGMQSIAKKLNYCTFILSVLSINLLPWAMAAYNMAVSEFKCRGARDEVA